MRYLLFLGFVFFSLALAAQSINNYDISFEGHYAGENGSDAGFQTQSLQVKILQHPINQGKGGVVMANAMCEFAEINFNDHHELFDDLERYYGVGFMLGYLKGLKNRKWSFVGMVIPQLNSNFTEGVKGRDLYLNVVALLNYSRTADTRLSFGLAYTNTLGIPAPIPIISYWKSWNKKIEMNLGFPRLSVTNHFNEKSSLVAYTEMKGYNGNISKNLSNPLFEKNRIAQRISYRDILAGCEYRYTLKWIQLKLNAGYTLSREFELKNTDNKTAYKFDMDNSFNIGLGVDFNW